MTDTEYVSLFYRLLLGREPDDLGLNQYLNLIESCNGDLRPAIHSILQSEEYGSRIEPPQLLQDVGAWMEYVRVFYNSLLGREPDEPGLALHVNLIASRGGDLRVAIDAILESEEYLNRIIRPQPIEDVGPRIETDIDGTSIKRFEHEGREIRIAGRQGDSYFDHLDIGDGTNDLLLKVAQGLPKDAIVVDVGANIGFTTALLSHYIPEGRIISIEPSPSAFPLLQKTLNASRVTNSIPYQVAFGGTPGKADFLDNADSASASHLATGGQTLGESNSRVEVTTLDAFVLAQGLTRIDLIKMDVEGFEVEVLAGARNVLTTLKPNWILEFNSFTLMAYGDQNPRRVLENLLETFPYVYRFEAGRMIEISTRSEQLHFLHENLVKHGCVDDLYCRYTPIE